MRESLGQAPAVLSGYNNRPELTPNALWMGTSKRGTFSGAMKTGSSLHGSTDDQFSCGGENINPKEVELLLVQHPEIVDAVGASAARSQRICARGSCHSEERC